MFASSLSAMSRKAAQRTCGAAVSPARGVAKNVRRLTVSHALFGLGQTATGGMYDISVKVMQDIDGRDLKLSKYAGKVVLICNVASQCGFTPQYEGLAELYDKYSSKGLVVLGAPCNQFGSQEPGSESEIKQFAKARGAKFPLLAKLDVNGGNESPLYSFLKKEQGGLLTSDVKWNFTKFLVDREGNVVGRYFSTTEPADIEKDIAKYL